MSHRLALRLGAAFVGLATLLPLGTSARAEQTITLGTIAPKQSLWGKVFDAWGEAVRKKSDGKLTIQVYYNGTQGDDAAMIGKLRAGQLDAAAVSSVGLSQIHKPMLALQLPGLFRSWAGVDRARDAVGPELVRGAEAEGFVVRLGDIGRLRSMARGFAPRTPGDLRGRKVLAWRNDVIGPTVQQLIGQIAIVPLSPPEVLPALRQQTIDALSAPALAAEQLQWAPQLDHVGADSVVVALGGMVFSKKRLDALPGDLRAILDDTGARASAALRQRVRAEDDAAYERLATKMTVVKLTDAERAAWAAVFEKAIARLRQGTFDPKLVDRLVALREP
jgi:TRAP-type C4-dicarboxylate transport system substrate-binding protein